MQFSSNLIRSILVAGMAAVLLSSCGLHRKPYDNPITKDTLQPDKVLFDRAIGDIEHGRYEVARLTLNTLLNTYDTSEYLAKAKLAIADSWYREGSTHGFAQAEAEYKDFILFYPNMEESAEAQWRVCDIHYKQMEKADRDNTQASRAEEECRQLLVQFPNSKYRPRAEQMLRNTQEVLAEKEFRTGTFYHTKGSFPAAANRLAYLADQYPLYSSAPEALWEMADSYRRMGDRFENNAAAAYTRIARDYPLSDRADDAKRELETMKRPIPQPDPAAIARMKYDEQNAERASMFYRTTEIFRRGPNTFTAARAGTPAMTPLRPPVPVSVPATAAGALGTTGGTTDVSVQQVGNTSELDSKPDARQTLPGAGGTATGAADANASSASTDSTTPAEPQQPLPNNHQLYSKQKKKKAKKQKGEPETQAAPAPAPVTAPHTTPTAPASTNPPPQ